MIQSLINYVSGNTPIKQKTNPSAAAHILEESVSGSSSCGENGTMIPTTTKSPIPKIRSFDDSSPKKMTPPQAVKTQEISEGLILMANSADKNKSPAQCFVATTTHSTTTTTTTTTLVTSPIATRIMNEHASDIPSSNEKGQIVYSPQKEEEEEAEEVPPSPVVTTKVTSRKKRKATSSVNQKDSKPVTTVKANDSKLRKPVDSKTSSLNGVLPRRRDRNTKKRKRNKVDWGLVTKKEKSDDRYLCRLANSNQEGSNASKKRKLGNVEKEETVNNSSAEESESEQLEERIVDKMSPTVRKTRARASKKDEDESDEEPPVVSTTTVVKRRRKKKSSPPKKEKVVQPNSDSDEPVVVKTVVKSRRKKS